MGAYPTVVTGDTEWGGGDVPGTEHNLYSERIETQARLIANVPRMLNALQSLMQFAEAELENLMICLQLPKSVKKLLELSAKTSAHPNLKRDLQRTLRQPRSLPVRSKGV
jgi:hypothetical protein